LREVEKEECSREAHVKTDEYYDVIWKPDARTGVLA